MKRILIAFTMIFFALSLEAQVLEENKVDEFTKRSVTRTSWEKLLWSGRSVAYFRMSKLDGVYFFDFKYFDGSVFSIDQDAELMFKFDNDSIYSIRNLKFVITEQGGGAIGINGSGVPGINTSYVSFGDPQFKMLTQHKIVKFRLHTNKGYIEHEVKPKFAETVINAVNLINENIE